MYRVHIHKNRNWGFIYISISVNLKKMFVCLKDYHYEAISILPCYNFQLLSLRKLKRNVLKNDIGVIAYCIIRVFIYFLILNEVFVN